MGLRGPAHLTESGLKQNQNPLCSGLAVKAHVRTGLRRNPEESSKEEEVSRGSPADSRVRVYTAGSASTGPALRVQVHFKATLCAELQKLRDNKSDHVSALY